MHLHSIRILQQTPLRHEEKPSNAVRCPSKGYGMQFFASARPIVSLQFEQKGSYLISYASLSGSANGLVSAITSFPANRIENKKVRQDYLQQEYENLVNARKLFQVSQKVFWQALE